MEKEITYIKVVLSIAGGMITQYMGGYDTILSLLVWLVMADFILGCLWGVKAKDFSSTVAKWGFVTKFVYFATVAICVKIDMVIGKDCFIRNIAIIWFALCEGASVLENAAKLGAPLPAGLLDVLVQAKNGFSIRVTDIVKTIVLEYSGQQKESKESGEK